MFAHLVFRDRLLFLLITFATAILRVSVCLCLLISVPFPCFQVTFHLSATIICLFIFYIWFILCVFVVVVIVCSFPLYYISVRCAFVRWLWFMSVLCPLRYPSLNLKNILSLSPALFRSLSSFSRLCCFSFVLPPTYYVLGPAAKYGSWVINK